MKKTSVVVLNYNGRQYLERFLPTLIEYTPNADIVLADNCSTDDSVAFLKKNGLLKQIQLIQMESNGGFSQGYNLSLGQLDTEYFVLLNSDVEVTKNWLDPLVEFLDQNPEYAAVQPKILDYNNRQYFEYSGAAGGYLDYFGYPFCRGRIFDHVEKDEGQYKDCDIVWGCGAALLIRSSVYFELGGLDEDFFAHMEEIDLCWRAISSGRKIRYMSNSKVYHVGGGTLSKQSPFKTYLNFRNNLYLVLKNLPISILIWKLPIRLFLDVPALFKYFINLKFGDAMALVRAHVIFIHSFAKIYRKRKKNLLSSPLMKYSIVYQYFILKKNIFTEISKK